MPGSSCVHSALGVWHLIPAARLCLFCQEPWRGSLTIRGCRPAMMVQTFLGLGEELSAGFESRFDGDLPLGLRPFRGWLELCLPCLDFGSCRSAASSNPIGVAIVMPQMRIVLLLHVWNWLCCCVWLCVAIQVGDALRYHWLRCVGICLLYPANPAMMFQLEVYRELP